MTGYEPMPIEVAFTFSYILRSSTCFAIVSSSYFEDSSGFYTCDMILVFQTLHFTCLHILSLHINTHFNEIINYYKQ